LLQPEIILFAEKLCHAAVFIFNRAHGDALCMHPLNIEAMFLQHVHKAFCLAMELRAGIIHWDHGIFLFLLLPSIRLVHIKGIKHIWPKQGVCGRLIKHK
jgi:hypothetical protein